MIPLFQIIDGFGHNNSLLIKILQTKNSRGGLLSALEEDTFNAKTSSFRYLVFVVVDKE